MGNARPKGTSSVDDDDFAASFVLSRADVDAALAAEADEPQANATPAGHEVAASTKKYVYAGIAAGLLLLAAALSWLAL